MKHIVAIFFCLLLLSSPGCSNKTDDTLTLEGADLKFQEIITEEFKNPAVLKRNEQTLWIYYPTYDEIVALVVSSGSGAIPSEGDIKLRPLECFYKNKNFNIKYGIFDAAPCFKYAGYGMNYTEHFQKLQQNLMSAIQRSYLNVESNTNTSHLPEFIVLVIADITTGIKFESIYFFNDLKLTLGPAPYITGEEYLLRTISELRGDKKIIKDLQGKHLDYHDITMAEFLSKQIVNRINFKFERSDFPPMNELKDEILTIVATTLKIYDYQEYQNIILENLNDDLPLKIEPHELESYLPEE